MHSDGYEHSGGSLMAAMADQLLESRVARLESALADIRSEMRRQESANADKKRHREEIAFNILMTLLYALVIAGLAHGFKWL